MKDKTCGRSNRCGADKCEGSDCNDYVYNHKSFRAYFKQLPCKLTHDELIDQGDRLCKAKNIIKEQEDKLETCKALVKGAIKEQEGIIEQAVKLMESKAEERTIKCEEVKDFIAKQVTIRRLDTNEIIEERPLKDDETQQEMDRVLAEADSQKQQEPELLGPGETDEEESSETDQAKGDAGSIDEETDVLGDEDNSDEAASDGEAESLELEPVIHDDDEFAEKCTDCGAILPRGTEDIFCGGDVCKKLGYK